MWNCSLAAHAKTGSAGAIEFEEYLPTWDTYANHSQASNPVYIAKTKETKPIEKPILVPAMFIEKALKAAKGRELKAKDVYAAYALLLPFLSQLFVPC